ncbi:hypothetical protein ACE10Z_15530 [Bradyrhizobium sp. Pha-3]|uniref:hypothetical protein n=1 Tax=Bradyrhizobium sp. Pha-3 TaxID=208375 RepID=UPI0035D4085E
MTKFSQARDRAPNGRNRCLFHLDWHREALITFVRKSNWRGDCRHPHDSLQNKKMALNAPMASPSPPKDDVKSGHCPCRQERNGGHLAMPLLGEVFQNVNNVDPHDRQVFERLAIGPSQ